MKCLSHTRNMRLFVQRKANGIGKFLLFSVKEILICQLPSLSQATIANRRTIHRNKCSNTKFNQTNSTVARHLFAENK